MPLERSRLAGGPREIAHFPSAFRVMLLALKDSTQVNPASENYLIHLTQLLKFRGLAGSLIKLNKLNHFGTHLTVRNGTCLFTLLLCSLQSS
jgi:hypothetical protein